MGKKRGKVHHALPLPLTVVIPFVVVALWVGLSSDTRAFKAPRISCTRLAVSRIGWTRI